MKVTSNRYLTSQEHVCSLEAKVRDHEGYNSELQEVEKWLLQMSGRLVAPDLMETSSLETITQQLAHHKVRLTSKELKDTGRASLNCNDCAERIRSESREHLTVENS